MRVPIVCRSAQIDTSTKGLSQLDGFIKITADMSDDQIQDVFFEIWNKVGDDVLEKWINAEGFKLTLTNQKAT